MVALYVAARPLSGRKRLASRFGGQAAGAADGPGVEPPSLPENGQPLSWRTRILHIVPARAADAADLLALRNHYIAHSFATFDEAPLTLAAVQAWMAAFADAGPHRLLVARDGPRLLGYCSSQAYRAHPAFSRTIETSVYVAPDAAGTGVGAALYGWLFEDLAGADLHRAVVGIALPNPASSRLHERFGFRTVGVFDEYAHKHGRAISSQWMQRAMDAAAQ